MGMEIVWKDYDVIVVGSGGAGSAAAGALLPAPDTAFDIAICPTHGLSRGSKSVIIFLHFLDSEAIS